MAETESAIDYVADFQGIDDLPRHLRTCAAMQPEVQVILPARVALQLARRIEAGRALPPEPVAFSWLDRTERLVLGIAAGLVGALAGLIAAGLLP
jgi:hypothetical protein